MGLMVIPVPSLALALALALAVAVALLVGIEPAPGALIDRIESITSHTRGVDGSCASVKECSCACGGRFDWTALQANCNWDSS